MKAAEEAVEQVAQGCGVPVPEIAAVMVVGSCSRGLGRGDKCPDPACGGQSIVLTFRWVMEMLRPEARVIGAEPA